VIDIPHFLVSLPELPTPPHELHGLEMPLLLISIVIAFTGLGIAAYFFGGRGKRAERIAPRFAKLNVLLAGKYFVDEAYDRFLARPLYWISERVFLRLGDRVLIDGALDGMARMAERTAGMLSRVQTGSLHLYAFLVLIGTLAALAWSFHHG
jgi:NADH-quinone oxidoreductase subunit L